MSSVKLVYIHGIGGGFEDRQDFYVRFHRQISLLMNEYLEYPIDPEPVPIIWPEPFEKIDKEHMKIYEDPAADRRRDRYLRENKFVFVWAIAIFLFGMIQVLGGNHIAWRISGLIFVTIALAIAYSRSRDSAKWLYYRRRTDIDRLLIQILWFSQDQNARKEISEHITAELKTKLSGSDVIFVGHSLGSVILANYLNDIGCLPLEDKTRKYDPPFNVKGVITMGSPLGIYLSSIGLPAVGQRLESTRNSKEYSPWYNLYDEADLVARPLFKALYYMQKQKQLYDCRVENPRNSIKSIILPQIVAHTGYWNGDAELDRMDVESINKGHIKYQFKRRLRIPIYEAAIIIQTILQGKSQFQINSEFK